MDGEHAGGVTGEGLDREAGKDFGRCLDRGEWEIWCLGVAKALVVWGEATEAVRVEQGELAGGEEWVVVGGEIADAVAVVLEAPVGELTGGEEVARVGEGGGDGAVGVEGGVPAAMVEVQVGVEDVGHLFGADAGGGEGGGEKLLVGVDFAHFG